MFVRSAFSSLSVFRLLDSWLLSCFLLMSKFVDVFILRAVSKLLF